MRLFGHINYIFQFSPSPGARWFSGYRAGLPIEVSRVQIGQKFQIANEYIDRTLSAERGDTRLNADAEKTESLELPTQY